jgi:hypothetical protein
MTHEWYSRLATENATQAPAMSESDEDQRSLLALGDGNHDVSGRAEDGALLPTFGSSHSSNGTMNLVEHHEPFLFIRCERLRSRNRRDTCRQPLRDTNYEHRRAIAPRKFGGQMQRADGIAVAVRSHE